MSPAAVAPGRSSVSHQLAALITRALHDLERGWVGAALDVLYRAAQVAKETQLPASSTNCSTNSGASWLSSVTPTTSCFVADIRNEASRLTLQSILELQEAAVERQALAVVETTTARYIALMRSTSGGAVIVPLANVRELLRLGRFFYDVAAAHGVIQSTPLGLDWETLSAISDDYSFLAGRTGGRA